MDLGFFRRASQGFADRSAATLDYPMLVTTLRAMQSATPAARAEGGAGVAKAASEPGNHPILDILAGSAGWREAVGAQGGCFNAGVAHRRRNGL